MPKFFGYKPAGPTKQAAEKFENEIMIRHDSQQLVGTVYLDMQENAWAVAVAYNFSRAPDDAQMYRSDPGTVTTLKAGPFPNPDSFARYALGHERDIVTRAG